MSESVNVPDSTPTEVSPVAVPAEPRKCQECNKEHGSGVVVTTVKLSIHKPTSRNTGMMIEENINICSAACHSKALQKFFNKHYPPNVHGLAMRYDPPLSSQLRICIGCGKPATKMVEIGCVRFDCCSGCLTDLIREARCKSHGVR